MTTKFPSHISHILSASPPFSAASGKEIPVSGPNPAVAVLSVSEAEVVIVREREGLLGFGKVLVGDQVAIRGIALRAAPPPRFVRPVYPSKKLNGQEYQFVYPIRRDLAEAIERALVRKYEEVIDRLTK